MLQSCCPLCIGLVADTHGLLWSEALERLRGCDQLTHAGDIGKPEILAELERLASFSVVCGNNDTQDWVADILEHLLLKIGRLTFYVLYDLKQLSLDPTIEGINVVVARHSRKSLKEERDGVFYFSPGSTEPRRFSLPIGIGMLEVAGKGIEAELVTLWPRLEPSAAPSYLEGVGRRIVSHGVFDAQRQAPDCTIDLGEKGIAFRHQANPGQVETCGVR